jgi:hypothetical protein
MDAPSPQKAAAPINATSIRLLQQYRPQLAACAAKKSAEVGPPAGR